MVRTAFPIRITFIIRGDAQTWVIAKNSVVKCLVGIWALAVVRGEPSIDVVVFEQRVGRTATTREPMVTGIAVQGTVKWRQPLDKEIGPEV